MALVGFLLPKMYIWQVFTYRLLRQTEAMAGHKGSKYYDIFLDFSVFLKHKEGGIPC
jgi:hypothetical protein